MLLVRDTKNSVDGCGVEDGEFEGLDGCDVRTLNSMCIAVIVYGDENGGTRDIAGCKQSTENIVKITSLEAFTKGTLYK